MKASIIFLILSFFHFSKAVGQADDSGISNLFSIYSNYISDTRGQNCPMYPSCSRYSIQAFSEFGALKGVLLTSDRLIRCGHEQSIYDLYWENKQPKFEDFPNWSFKEPALPKQYPPKFSQNISFYNTRNDTTFFLSLINSRAYQSAIVEYKRMVHFGSKNEQTLILELNYLIALNALGDHEKVIFHYDNQLTRSLKADPRIIMELADAWFRLNNFEKSISTLQEIDSTSYYSPYKNLLNGVALSYLDNYDAAISEFNQIDPNFIYAEYAKSNIKQIHDIASIKRKKPYVAGILGLVPGGGYFYAGQTTTGITSLVLTGLLGYASYTSFSTKNHGVGILTGIFTLTFYSGSITGGINSIKRQNLNSEKKMKSKLLYVTQ